VFFWAVSGLGRSFVCFLFFVYSTFVRSHRFLNVLFALVGFSLIFHGPVVLLLFACFYVLSDVCVLSVHMRLCVRVCVCECV